MGGINKREHLIKTGQELIWAKGYDLCSIKDITNLAGLPKGSFYHYFESKEKFALEAMQEFIENNPEKVKGSSYTLQTFEDLIDKRIKSIVKVQFAKECYMSVMCHAYSDQEDNFRQDVVNAIDKSNDTMRNLLSDLLTNGHIRKELQVNELLEYIDFTWRGARLKARMLKSDKPLKLFKKYLVDFILKP